MLQVKDLCKTYGDRPVLNHLNLCIHPGEIYGLLGPNGAGKTTTINILCHLLQPDSGYITINHQPVSEGTKSLIGLAPQDNLLYKSLTCAENLDFFASLYGLSRRQRQQRIPACLEAVGLLDRAQSRAEVLSGGMQRRLSLAIALIHSPKLLILDEPTTGLDLEARQEIWGLLRQLPTHGIAVLLTTHLLDEAERLCQRIGILKQGHLLAEGSFSQLRCCIPAQEIVLLQTSHQTQVIERASELGWSYRYYGNDLALWLPETLELQEILAKFVGIPLDSIARQPVRLEHVYDEIVRDHPGSGLPP